MKKKLYFLSIIFILSLCLYSCEKNDDSSIDDSFKRENLIAEEVKDCDTSTKQIKETNDELSDYEIIWSDEFNYTGTPDSSKWSYELGTGNGGWGNNELQTYTNKEDNAYVKDGNLYITAKREDYNGQEYTSSRLVTKNKGDFKYGYIEMRAILPSGGGVWPAFWMMPTDSVYGTWPASGEIDIMEYVGNNKNKIFNTVHCQRYYGSGRGTTYTVNGVEESYHTYGLLWTEDYIKFYCDDVERFTVKNGKFSENNWQSWPYDQNFFIILNVAMGGNLGGKISDSFVESSMIVDYVRVYQKNLKGIDKTKPEKVVINNYTVSSSSINLNWNQANDDYGIKQYEVVVDGKQVLATTKTNCVINNLQANKEYTVQVIALDKGGNFSVSKAVKIKTCDVLKIPGKIEIEQYSSSQGINTLENPNNSLSVDFIVTNNNPSYIICEVTTKESGTYSIECYLQGNRTSTLYVYTVSNTGEGTKNDGYNITNTFGAYKLVKLDYTLNLNEGINYIKIECVAETNGKTATIDYLNLVIDK